MIIQVAAISGDARRALEICRRAAEIADYRVKKLISNPDCVTAGIWACFINFACHHGRKEGSRNVSCFLTFCQLKFVLFVKRHAFFIYYFLALSRMSRNISFLCQLSFNGICKMQLQKAYTLHLNSLITLIIDHIRKKQRMTF